MRLVPTELSDVAGGRLCGGLGRAPCRVSRGLPRAHWGTPGDSERARSRAGRLRSTRRAGGYRQGLAPRMRVPVGVRACCLREQEPVLCPGQRGRGSQLCTRSVHTMVSPPILQTRVWGWGLRVLGTGSKPRCWGQNLKPGLPDPQPHPGPARPVPLAPGWVHV